MWCLLLCFALLLSFAVGCLAQPAQPLPASPTMQTTVPKLSDDILLNPRMGLYLQYPPLDAKPDEWWVKMSDIAYYRLDWNTINPEEGVYKFDAFFGPMFDFWVKQMHKRVAFRVMCQSMHSAGKYVTPKWVFDRGVPGVTHINLRGEEQIDPVFWDERYLQVQAEFIARLGEYLDGREGLEFVDIGSIGEWGEMHLARWTPEQLEKTGFTHTKYVMAYRRIIDAFVEAFPRTQIFLNVGGQDNQTINDYAAIRGCHFRQDGLNPAGASYDCGEWLYKPYSRRGTVCNFEFHSGLDDMRKKGWDLKATLDKGLSAPISYLNTNLGNYRTLPPEARELLLQAGRRIGYRFVLTSLQHPPAFSSGAAAAARIPLISTWRNDGVAPGYDSFALEWSLADDAGKIVGSEVIFPRVPTTQWWPGQEIELQDVLRVPGALPAGNYHLKVAMVLPETGRHIGLGIAGRDADSRYDLCTLQGILRKAATATAFEEGFEQTPKPWSGVPGITVAVDKTRGHTGAASLAISGTAPPKTWNYVNFRVPAPLVPFGLYKLTAWMLVEDLRPAANAPYIKLAVNDAQGKWINNHNSGTYDMKQPGTWQRLEAIAEVPPQGASGDIAIEKGNFDAAITTRMWLDDVNLELIEAP